MPRQFKNKKFIFISLILFLIVGAFLFWNYFTKDASATGDGWLENWTKRKQITIVNNSKDGTIYGNPVLGSTGKFGTSMVFDGTDDYIGITSSDDLKFGTGDFTIDMWVNPTVISSDYNVMAGASDGSSYNWMFSAGTGDGSGDQYKKFHFYSSLAGVSLCDSSVLTINNWTHVAVVRSGNTWTLYKNGVSVATATSSSSFDPTYQLRIGGLYYYNAAMFHGYIDEVRISKGIARWTSNFTPPTSPYTPDTYDKLLLHLNEAVGSTKVGSINFPGGELYGNPVLGSTGKFGTSMAFDGTDDYVYIPSSSDWDFGTGDFTIDSWVNFSNTETEKTIAASASGTGWIFEKHYEGGSPGLHLYDTNASGHYVYAPYSFSTGTWYHVAVVRSGSVIKFFVNGTQIGTDQTPYSGGYNSGGNGIVVGKNMSPGTIFNGYIDELRISKGIARWTANFTPPTSAYTPDSDTKLLLHLNEVAGSVAVTDSSKDITNYQALITVSYDSDMQADFDDLRFTSSDGSTLLDYWLESKTNSSTANVWVEIPYFALGNNTIYMYYGNFTVSSVSNGPNVFDFFDDFSSGLSKWTVQSKAGYTTAEVTSGELVVHRNVDWNYIMAAISTNSSFSKTTPWVISFNHRIVGSSTWGDCANRMKAMLVSFSGTVSRNAYDSGGCATQGHASTNYSYLWHNTGNVSTYKSLEVQLDGAGQMKVIDNGVAGSWQAAPSWADISSSGFNFELIGMGAGGGGNDDHCYFDDVIIRKYLAISPTIVFGSEEIEAASSIHSISISTANEDICKTEGGRIVCKSGEMITFESTTYGNKQIKLYVCKDASCTNCGISSQSNCWAYSSSYVTSNPTATYNSSCYAGSCGTGECEYTGTPNQYWAMVCSSSTCSDIIASDEIIPTYVSTCVSGGGLTCTETLDGSYVVYEYTLSGTTTGSTTWTVPARVNSIDYLVVGGGGGGGMNAGAGGGGGGFVEQTGKTVNSGNSYTVTVGAGGAGATSQSSKGVSGYDSVFGLVVAKGGGGGGSWLSQAGANGGSGGGSASVAVAGSTIQDDSDGGTGYGNNGGIGWSGYNGGGGGGAGTVGQSSPAAGTGGAGGNGRQSSITGTTYYYAGGGGAGGYGAGTGIAGNGGFGGGGGGSNGQYLPMTGGGFGGTGGTSNGGDGVASGAAGNGGPNTGGGGGGNTGSVSPYLGGNGGSGVVIIRFLKP